MVFLAFLIVLMVLLLILFFVIIASGISLIAAFSDVIICGLIVMLIYKLIQRIKNRRGL